MIGILVVILTPHPGSVAINYDNAMLIIIMRTIMMVVVGEIMIALTTATNTT